MTARDKIVETLVGAISTDEVIDLEKRLIRTRSYTLEETPLAELIVEYLREQGIDAVLQQVPVPAHLQSSNLPHVSHNVVGRLPGHGDGSSLLFNGHMDVNATDLAVGGTAFTGYSTWTHDPFTPTVENGRIYGKGAYDEKGGLCAFLAATVAIKRAGVRLRGDLYVCPVMGHYSESIGTKHMMREGPRARYGICAENSGSWIVPAHNGGILAEVRVRGVNPGTKYTLPETLQRATGFENAVRFVRALGSEGVPHPRDGWLRFSPHAVLPEFPNHRIGYLRPVDNALDQIAIGLLLKTVPGMDEQTCTEDLARLLKTLCETYADFPGGEVRCRCWSPPLVTQPDSRVVEALARAHRTATGRDPVIGTEARRGAMGDSGVMSAAGIETCIFGPGIMHDVSQLRGEGPPDESISIQELVAAAHTMMFAAVSLCS